MNRIKLFLVVAGVLGFGGVALADSIVHRVISLSPIITETIYLLDAQQQLIGNTSYCNRPDEARFKEKIGSVIQMNVEKIIGLRPDLVIASALSREKQLKILEQQSIPLLRTQNPKTFDQMCEMTLKIGATLGREARAKIIVERAREQANHILELTRSLAKPRVFLQIGLKPLHSANKDMFINEYIRYCGGINIAENESSGIYSREKVIRNNPNIILIATMGTSKRAGEFERQKWTTFKSIDAVKNNRVHVLDPEMICSPTPDTFVQGLRVMLPLLHPGGDFNE